MNFALLRPFVERYLSEPQKNRLRRLRTKASAFFAASLFKGNLGKLSTFYGAGKLAWYLPLYDRHFRHLRHKRINVLEIGIGGYDAPMAGGGSLRMWRTYFSRARVYGLDIYDKAFHDERRIKTIRGSQMDLDLLASVARTIGRIDVIIDDGSHQNEHVITTFKALFPHLDKNGIYVVEDTQTSYWHDFGGSSEENPALTTIMQYFKALTDEVNYEEITRGGYEPSEFAMHLIGLHFYHNILFIEKGLT